MTDSPFIIFDDAAQDELHVFAHPDFIIRADEANDVDAALRAIQTYRDAGYYLAGYFSYELGYVLEEKLQGQLPAECSLPLLWFGAFRRCQHENHPDKSYWFDGAGRAYVGQIEPEWDRDAYEKRFREVIGFIKSGDIYQANLSMRAKFDFVGDPLGLYWKVRKQARASYGVYLDDGSQQILSFSPELFFSLGAEGAIRTRPMKGTAPRAASAEADSRQIEGLQASCKNRAENLMIVDLLRNDLGRIAESGSVSVSDLFTIETYPTVHQMVSEVSANLRKDVGIRNYIRALFPCGSITGAPKIRAMTLLRELETSSRGVYSGAMGYFAPDGTATFNVAIRTLTLRGNQGELGIGGGIVMDSTCEEEYEEALLKARYLQQAQHPLKLIETFRYEPSAGFVRLDLHLRRLQKSASVFGFPFEIEQLLLKLEEVKQQQEKKRVRLTLDATGKIDLETAPFQAVSHWRFRLANSCNNSHDLLLGHKTSWRQRNEREYQCARSEGYDEVLFLNERDELCEGAISNLFLSMKGTLVTPEQKSGLLGGCLRQELLAAGECHEAVLTLADLDRAEKVYLGNSLRGLIPASRY